MMNLFGCLFGWRKKGSKWNRLIKSIPDRVQVLNNNRETIIRQSRKDIVQLLKNGEDQRAFIKVDILSKDQNIAAAYDLLGDFSEVISINLPYIRQHKDCPDDINQAASSLLYASAWCGDLPELLTLRKLFRKSYGEDFVNGAIELLPGNQVNRQVIEKLSVKSISNEVKFKLMKEIAIDNGLELNLYDKDCDFSCALDDFDLEKKATYVAEESLNSNQINSAARVEKPKEMDHHLYEPEITLHRFSSQSHSGVSSSSSRASSASIHRKTESHVTEPASENSSQLSERNIVYHDDLEEFKVQPRVQEHTKDKDESLFMFKSTFTPPQGDNRANLSVLNECDLYTDNDRMKTCEKSDAKTSSRNTTVQKRKSTRRRLNRRHNQIENQMCSCSTLASFNIKDMESEMYYKKKLNRRVSSKNSQKKKLTSTEQWYCEQRKPEERYTEDGLPGESSECSFDCDVEDNCYSEGPCYFVTSEDIDDSDCPTPKSSVYNQSHKPEVRRKEVESYASSSGSRFPQMSPLMSQTQAHPTYLRASMSMPQRERPKDVVQSDQIVKSASCEFLHKSNYLNGSSSSPCRCIHPKLPDYDELAARFKAFKQDYIYSVVDNFTRQYL